MLLIWVTCPLHPPRFPSRIPEGCVSVRRAFWLFWRVGDTLTGISLPTWFSVCYLLGDISQHGLGACQSWKVPEGVTNPASVSGRREQRLRGKITCSKSHSLTAGWSFLLPISR